MDITTNVTPAIECTAPTMPGEEWRLIMDERFVPGRYYVSGFGRVFDKKRDVILPQHIDRDGYKKVTLHRCNGRGRPTSVHTLVADAFLPPPTEEQTSLDHINGDPADNRAENLKRCTQKENINNPISLQRQREAAKRRGVIQRRRVMCWETGDPFESVTAAADAYGLSGNTVSKSCRSGIIPEPGVETIINGRVVRHFCYIDENDNPIPMERRIPAHRNQPIRCLETHKCYATIAAAAEKLDITYEAIRVALRRKRVFQKHMTEKMGKPIRHFEWISRDVYLAWLAEQETAQGC